MPCWPAGVGAAACWRVVSGDATCDVSETTSRLRILTTVHILASLAAILATWLRLPQSPIKEKENSENDEGHPPPVAASGGLLFFLERKQRIPNMRDAALISVRACIAAASSPACIAASPRRIGAPPLMLSSAELGGLVAAFSVTHIGLSAVREGIIDGLGSAAGSLGLVGRGWKLPSIWLADTTGLEIWPDEAIAGRQIYRAFYTFVASALLFPALLDYPEVRGGIVATVGANSLDVPAWWLAFAVASAAQAISIASLVNPSPLSLVPGFEEDDEAIGGVKRDDALKLVPRGLTRITRHPLILPVVPWGLANAALAGWHAPDVGLFCGLALYALAGCKAQDLRVEASNQVGTVFSDSATGSDGALTAFYRDTSFAPFGAILDGRQSLAQARAEVPLSALAGGLVVGAAIEWAFLQWIGIEMPFGMA